MLNNKEKHLNFNIKFKLSETNFELTFFVYPGSSIRCTLTKSFAGGEVRTTAGRQNLEPLGALKGAFGSFLEWKFR